MIQSGQDTIFIVAAYLGVALGVVALIGLVVRDALAARARLAALEARGIRRRTERGAR